MKKVRAKKHLGQHFLIDLAIAERTAEAFNEEKKFSNCIEVGPGMGVLTKYLCNREELNLYIIDIDNESIDYLQHNTILKSDHIIYGDFLKYDLDQLFQNQHFGIVGNFPYNISSQILFKALDHKDNMLELVGMFQKEVADRVVSKPGSKVYGITSVLLQAYYDMEYLFTVDKESFDPPPKVQSAVIRLKRNAVQKLDCDEKLFKTIVKASFNQRRKTLRNSLKSFMNEQIKSEEIFNKRPEQLAVQDFIDLCNMLAAK